MDGPDAAKPMRADARRNYQRLLAVAGTAFTEHGTDASLKDIARAAGVGIGTLYRHFPTREALLEALLHERFDELGATAKRLSTAKQPGAALIEWAHDFIATATTYQGLVAALATTLRDETSDLHAACEGMRDAATHLLVRAQKAGEVRTDLAPGELFLFINGIAWADEQASTPDSTRIHRLLDIVLKGMAA